MLEILTTLQFNDKEKEYLRAQVGSITNNWQKEAETICQTITLRLAQIKDRVARLTDAFIDGSIDKDIYDERKTALLMERKDLEERLLQLKDRDQCLPDQLSEFLELAETAYLRYKMGSPEEKRDLVRTITSNRQADEKNVYITLKIPFEEIKNRLQDSDSSPQRDTSRTLSSILLKGIAFMKTQMPRRDPDQLAA